VLLVRAIQPFPTIPCELLARPGGSAARPVGSAARPGGSAARPGGSAARPGGSAARPGGSAARPGGSAARPRVSRTCPDLQGSSRSLGIERIARLVPELLKHVPTAFPAPSHSSYLDSAFILPLLPKCHLLS
jgi:hypothetical protein